MADDVKLQVSIRKEMLRGVSSCIHAKSEIELLNTHSSESITIRSLRTTKEDVVLVQGNLEYDIEAEVAKQVHVTRLPNGDFKLEPGQKATIPITFLPRFPHDDEDLIWPSGWDESAPPLSIPVKADLARLVGEEAIERTARHGQRRSNKGLYKFDFDNDDEYEVRTALIVESSRGLMEVPVLASSYKHNMYGVPQMIYFRHTPMKNEHLDPWIDEVLILDTIALHKGSLTTMSTVTSDVPVHECYDVYLSNPRDHTYLEVNEVLVSKPDLVSLFDKNQDPYFEKPKRSIDSWTVERISVRIEKGEKDVYLATLCPYGGNNPLDLLQSPTVDAPKWVNDGKTQKDILGYLQIRTDKDTLFVVLQRQPAENLFAQPPDENLHEAIEKVFGKEFANGMRDVPIKDSLTIGTNSVRLKHRKQNLVASPRNLKNNLVGNVSPQVATPITIRNTYNETVKIMHVTLIIDKIPDGDVMEECRSTGLEISVHVRDSGQQCMATEENCVTDQGPYIRAGSALEGAVLFRASIDSNKTAEYLERTFVRTRYTGTVVLRATSDMDISYSEWKEKLKQNPFMDSNLILEIQYTVNVIDGQIHFLLERTTGPHPMLRYQEKAYKFLPSVKALFFPIQNFEMRSWMYWEKSQETYFPYDDFGLKHSMRILGSIPVVTNITNIRINSYGDHKSLCERFKISIDYPETTLNRPAKFGKSGLHDMGVLHVDYTITPHKVKEKEKKKRDSLAYTEVCYLEYETTPVNTGVHILPLLVFPARLDVAASEYSFVEDEALVDSRMSKLSEFSSSVVTGFDEVLEWFRSSNLGQALYKYLEQSSEGQKKSDMETGAYLLGRYIFKLGNATANESASLRPILLKVGAIGHSETQTTSLYLTNHNPIPVTVYVDVSEVEGSSIFLARDSSRGRGDGNCFLDYLPKLEPETFNTRIKSGKFKGHSREGLRQFLLNAEIAQSFYRIAPYRDAVSLSAVALKKNSLLQFMYKLNARMHFYAEKLPRHCFRTEGLRCNNMDHNPSWYYNFTTTRQDSKKKSEFPGPLVLSEDLKIAHHSVICDPPLEEAAVRERTLTSYRHPPVTIPPGGVARFEVRVRAPDESALQKDITPLLSTGLVLSTSHGQVMPIIVAFEALLGKLKVTNKRFKGDEFAGNTVVDEQEVIRVPPGLFKEFQINNENHTISPWLSTATTLGVNEGQENMIFQNTIMKLYLDSSFSRKVSLRYIESCNPWFHVELKEGASTGLGNAPLGTVLAVNERIEIGTIESMLDCPVIDTLMASEQLTTQAPVYPSFFQCAMAWIENRSKLQPHGCGLEPSPTENLYIDEEVVENLAEDDALDRARYALHHAITFSLVKYGGAKAPLDNGRSRRGEGEEGRDIIRAGPSSIMYNHPDSVDYATKSGASQGKELIDSLTLDVFAEITDAWRVIMELDLHSISTSLRATIDYEFPDTERSSEAISVPERHTLTMSMQNLAARTVLSFPLLFDHTRFLKVDPYALSFPHEVLSFINFPAARVGNVGWLKIPIRNPYAVPIRVRLAAASRSQLKNDGAYKSTELPILDSLDVRERYLRRLGPLFAQTSPTNFHRNQAGDSWWDGDGSFFMHDDHGNLIQSSQDDSIVAGAGTQVNLVNPSLFATSGLLVGCGARCGLHDGAGDNPEESTSPIGASAAAGLYMIGRRRSCSKWRSDQGANEPCLSADGSSSDEEAPAAFAIPYSSFDEVILPPYGTAELGPVYFRPPGRNSVLGCDAMLESKSYPWSPRTEMACESQTFESMVFLENSLTGLERVVVRGVGLWERVVFTDPAPMPGRDAFGDVEYRFGRSTLVFPGSGVKESYGLFGYTSHPVIKEFLIFNDGDIEIEFKSIFFTMATNLPKKRTRNSGADPGRSCEYRGFRLIGCFDSDERVVSDNDGRFTLHNLKYGFTLKPGRTRTLMIEHTPDCSYRSEYIALQFEYARGERSFHGEDTQSDESFSRSGKMRRENGNDWSRSFNRRFEELLVGFEMNHNDVSRCIPVTKNAKSPPAVIPVSLTDFSNSTNKYVLATAVKRSFMLEYHLKRFYSSNRRLGLAFGLCILFAVATCMIALLVRQLTCYRQKTSLRFRTTLRGGKGKSELDELGQQHDNLAHPSSNCYNNWSATFRCLARTDPTSSELQTLGREQVRQIVLNRYKSMGVLAPQCINGAGIFVRDRFLVSETTSKDGSLGNNGKIRTLSDSLFYRMVNEGDYVYGTMPCALGWKTAVARGIVSKRSRSSVRLNSANLLRERQIILEPRNSNEIGDSEEDAPFGDEGSDEEEDVSEDLEASDELVSLSGKSRRTVSEVIESNDRFSKMSNDDVDSVIPVETPTGDAISTSDSDGHTSRDEDSQVTKSSLGSLVVADIAMKKVKNHGAQGTTDRRVKPNYEDTNATDTTAKVAEKLEPIPLTSSHHDDNVTKAPMTKDCASLAVFEMHQVSSTSTKSVEHKEESEVGKQKRDRLEKEKDTKVVNPEEEQPSKAKNLRKKEAVPSQSSDRSTKSSQTPKSDSRSEQISVPSGLSKGSTTCSDKIRSQRMSGPRSAQSETSTKKERAKGIKKTKKCQTETKSKAIHEMTATMGSTNPGPMVSILRPPPGLAPPPGFGNTGGNNSACNNHTTPKNARSLPGGDLPPMHESLSQLAPILRGLGKTTTDAAQGSFFGSPTTLNEASTSNLFNSLLGHSSALFGESSAGLTDLSHPSLSMDEDIISRPCAPSSPGSHSLSDDGRSPRGDGRPLLGLGGGFNVMDFLDSILNDPKSREEGEQGANGPAELLVETTGTISEPVVGGTIISALPLSANPWAPSGMSSRAAAYGIAVDDPPVESGIVHAILAASPNRENSVYPLEASAVTLLTPAVFFPHNDNDDDDYNSGSFFAHLLGE